MVNTYQQSFSGRPTENVAASIADVVSRFLLSCTNRSSTLQMSCLNRALAVQVFQAGRDYYIQRGAVCCYWHF